MHIAHVDMDSFFCSCEIKRDPELKGKPVLVGGSGERGVVSAANYEARKFGVFSATPGRTAKNLCPEGIFLPVDKKFYKEESDKVMEILSTYTDTLQKVSIDEAYLDLTKYSESFDSLESMGKYIQKEILELTGLSCSIGIADSRIVAKIASDHKKPNGVTIVKDSKEFLKGLEIEKIPGIGKVSKKIYNENGIKIIGELAEMDTFKVIEIFGNSGVKYQKVAQGKDFSRINNGSKTKSISRETTFPENFWKKEKITEELMMICNQVLRDLKTKDFRTVSIKLRFPDFTTITRDKTLNVPSRSLADIRDSSLELLEKVLPINRSIRLLGVKLSKLGSGRDVQRVLSDYY